MAVFQAIKNNDLDLFKKVINEPNFNVNEIKRIGYSPLHDAVRYNNIEMVQQLLELGADVNAISNHKYTPLHFADDQNIEIMELLLKFGADIRIRNINGWTALHYACYNGALDKIDLLFNYSSHLSSKTIVCFEKSCKHCGK